MPLDPATELFRWTLLVWLTVLGGCLGSFLNVVVYRVPRGQNLAHPGSRCPECGHAIRWYHNIPVLGWLVLGGRCRDCHAPISLRYPVVEAVVAAVFFALAITGPLSDAALAAELSEASAPRSAPLWFAFAWEATLMCVLLALVLIDRDLAQGSDGRYPLPLIGGTFLLALILPMLMPSSLVHVHPAGGAPVSLRAALEHAAIGALAGCGCGCLFLAAGHPQGRRGMAGLRQAALPPLVGPYLGAWPIVTLVAATLLVFAAPLLLLAGRGSAWWRWPLLFWLGALAAIVCAHLRPLPFGRLVDSPLPLNMAILGTLLVALAMRRVVSRNRARRVE